MSDDLLTLIKQSWDRLWPELEKNPDELARRLSRRRMGMMNRPPRAWCLAIRAADTRINPATAIIVPEDAGYPRSHLVGVEQRLFEHEVTLDARLVRKLCAPVYTDWPYSTVQDLMSRLGCSLHNIRAAIRMGVFSVRKIPHLGGKLGRPVPVLYSKAPLDPGARLRKHPDPVWGTTCKYLCEHVPEDLCQTLTRVPERRGAVLPGMNYTGWKWICPGCKNPCRTIFYPLPPLQWVQLLKKEFHDTDPDHPDALRKGANTFACMKCHSVMYVGRVNYESWNRIVTHLSGGLLYGHEVKRPGWYVEQRIRAFHPVLNRPPSRRREQVLQMLMSGMGVTAIAMKLRVSKSRIGSCSSELYRRHGVKGVEELRKAVNRRTENPNDNDAVSGDIGSETRITEPGGAMVHDDS